MAHPNLPPREPPLSPSEPRSLWRRLFGRDNAAHQPRPAASTPAATPAPVSVPAPPPAQPPPPPEEPKQGLMRRMSRRVVPGMPRQQTFRRQQSEVRSKLEPVKPDNVERRTASVDRRPFAASNASHVHQADPRASAPEFRDSRYDTTLDPIEDDPASPATATLSPDDEDPRTSGRLRSVRTQPSIDDRASLRSVRSAHSHAASATTDAHSLTASQFDGIIHEELETIWILNLSMHFRDKSKREKFFVTYHQAHAVWRRVTVSLDYRSAPERSLEEELSTAKFQRDKNAKIYAAIRESLPDIQFYDTVTNLKLQTTDGRLHVHVVEDVNEIISFPPVRAVQHLGCRRVKEKDIEFDSHMSGFVYKVRVDGHVLIKKEIPGPETVPEFLYEVNALSALRFSGNVISFHGVIVDDNDDHVKGLLISYAEQGALVDMVYDHDHGLPWALRERWARQIVRGLADIHECGFVQGDFTLSNIVIDHDDNAKIIDINRRGCPVGWEPPEATALIQSGQSIALYIGVKSDLYQLGMVLWALATQEDEPEGHPRPLRLPHSLDDIPLWYRRATELCLCDDPTARPQAAALLDMFPPAVGGATAHGKPLRSVVGLAREPADDGPYLAEFGEQAPLRTTTVVRTVAPLDEWSPVSGGGFPSYDTGPHDRHPSARDWQSDTYFPPRGRSPPSPMPSNRDSEPSNTRRPVYSWSDTSRGISYASDDDAYDDRMSADESEADRSLTPRTNKGSVASAFGDKAAREDSGVAIADQPAPGKSVSDALKPSVRLDEPVSATVTAVERPGSGFSEAPLGAPAENKTAAAAALPDDAESDTEYPLLVPFGSEPADAAPQTPAKVAPDARGLDESVNRFRACVGELRTLRNHGAPGLARQTTVVKIDCRDRDAAATGGASLAEPDPGTRARGAYECAADSRPGSESTGLYRAGSVDATDSLGSSDDAHADGKCTCADRDVPSFVAPYSSVSKRGGPRRFSFRDPAKAAAPVDATLKLNPNVMDPFQYQTYPVMGLPDGGVPLEPYRQQAAPNKALPLAANVSRSADNNDVASGEVPGSTTDQEPNYVPSTAPPCPAAMDGAQTVPRQEKLVGAAPHDDVHESALAGQNSTFPHKACARILSGRGG